MDLWKIAIGAFPPIGFQGILLCFSFVYSKLFGALFLVNQWILIDLIIFIIQVFFYNKKISFDF